MANDNELKVDPEAAQGPTLELGDGVEVVNKDGGGAVVRNTSTGAEVELGSLVDILGGDLNLNGNAITDSTGDIQLGSSIDANTNDVTNVGSLNTDRAVLTEDADLSEDDTYLQSLVDKVGSDGTVRLPRGVYSISSALTLDGYDGLTITAPRGARLKADSGSPPTNLIEASATDNITLSGLTLDLNSQAATGLYTFNSRELDVESNYVTGDTASGSIGIHFDGDGNRLDRHGSTVRANQILGGDTGIQFNSKTPQYSEVYGNILQASGTNGIFLKDAENVGLTSNHVTNYDSGIFCETSLKCDLINNRANHVTNGIRFKGASGNDGMRAEFNKVNVTSGHSIIINGATNSIVSRNAVANTSSGSDAIHVQFSDTQNCLIENNHLGWRSAAGDNAINEESDVGESVIRDNVTRISSGYSLTSTANVSGNIII